MASGYFMSTDYLSYVPKDIGENLVWRRAWWKASETDLNVRRRFKEAAFDDVLFWFNAFGWCFEPRSVFKVRPFVTWPHQDPAIVTMDDAITRAEKTEEPVVVLVDKSRGQGATFAYVDIFVRRWLRDKFFTAGLVTRNEAMVDSLQNSNTVMWKVAWTIGMLPFWMLPDGFEIQRCRNLKDHTIVNPVLGSLFAGFPATGDVGRSGRTTVFALDEFATFKPGEDRQALNSTQHITNCRFIVSTFTGDSGAYFDAATKTDFDGKRNIKIILDWKDNPTQNRAMYKVEKEKIIPLLPEGLTLQDQRIIEEQHVRLRKRGYALEGKTRSIWYNWKCLETGATSIGIAQELDRNPHGAVSKVFSMETLALIRATKCLPPIVQGKLVYDTETAEVRPPYIAENESGELKLWTMIGLNGRMPPGSYILGADISSGTAGDFTSNSVACIIDKMTGLQVVEWVSNSASQTKFARVCVALARWFGNALIIPEANFGAGFLKAVIDDLAYENLYYRESAIEGLHEKTRKPGFWVHDDDVRLKIFQGMQEAMCEDAFTPRSVVLIDECKEYQWANGKIIHVASKASMDEGGKGRAHGDRVVAASLAWFGCREDPWSGEEKGVLSEDAIPSGSYTDLLKRHNGQQEANRRDLWGGTGLTFSGQRQ